MRGGAREGAGRKPIENPRRRLVLYVTDEERQQLASYLEALRLLQETSENVEALAISEEDMKALAMAEEELQEILETAATGETAAPAPATAARILEVEALNHGMTRGKWACIAGILNRNLQYDARLEPWTADSVKRAWYKLRKEKG